MNVHVCVFDVCLPSLSLLSM